MHQYNISYKGRPVGTGTLFKRAVLSSGYIVSLFFIDTKSSIWSHVVSVTRDGETVEFKRFIPKGPKSAPFTFYLDCICCYA